MSLKDLLLPWEGIKTATDALKKDKNVGSKASIKNAVKGDNHSSAVGAVGSIGQRFSDPLATLFGEKYLTLINDTLPTAVNSALSPVAKAGAKLDPLHYVGGDVGDAQKKGEDWITNKPGDTLAAVIGAIYGAGALAGSGGAGAGGGA